MSIDDIRYYVLMTFAILVILGWCGAIGYCIYDNATHCTCTCEEAP